LGHEIIGARREVERHLAIDLVFDRVGAQNVAETREPGHGRRSSSCQA
jgi:hypothetical protein